MLYCNYILFSSALLLLVIATATTSSATVNPDIPSEYSLADDQQVARFLSAEEDRLLQTADTASRQGLLQRCGNRNPCQDGFDCIRTGLGGKRCFPLECFTREMKALNFNASSYKEDLFQQARISEEDLKQTAAEADSTESFERTNIFQTFFQAFRERAQPMDKIQEIQRKCSFPEQQIALADSRNGTSPFSEVVEVGYTGCQYELGAVAEFSFSNFVGRNRLFNRICVGAGPQAGSTVAFLAGLMTNSDNPEDLGCASIWFDIDITALTGIGLAGGFGFNGKTYWEVTWNWGVSAGAGVASCATFQS